MSYSNNMEGMRRHQEKMALAKGYADSSKEVRMIVAGKNGEEFLKYFSDAAEIVGKR